MEMALRLAAVVFLGIAVVDGAIGYGGRFDPWENSADLPSGFFTLLRIFVTLLATYNAVIFFRMLGRASTIVLIYGFIAILFQPIFPVHFEYETWLWIDLAVLTFIVLEFAGGVYVGKRVIEAIADDELETQAGRNDQSVKKRPEEQDSTATTSRIIETEDDVHGTLGGRPYKIHEDGSVTVKLAFGSKKLSSLEKAKSYYGVKN